MNDCPPKTRIHAHHENQVALLEHILERGLRRLRVERHPGAFSERTNVREQAVQVRRGFRMNGDAVGPRGCIVVHAALGLGDHEVHVEVALGGLADRF